LYAAAKAAEQLERRARVLAAVAAAAARSTRAGPLVKAAPLPLHVSVVGHAVLSRPLTSQQRKDLPNKDATRLPVGILQKNGERETLCSLNIRFWALASGPPDAEEDGVAR